MSGKDGAPPDPMRRIDEGPPGYLELQEKGILSQRISGALAGLKSCRLCPRECKVDREGGERGFCRTGLQAMVSSYSPHFGEEDPLVGTGGSGTIFFTHCNLGCIFCQNYEISHLGEGREVSSDQLGQMMLHLQEMGCHNINFVSPTHVVPQILAALRRAIEGGLRIPLVYNTGGYDSLEALQLLDGIFDIYMPDLKFMEGDIADRLCRARDYPDRVQAAVREMHRQVGDLKLDSRGIAWRGLLVRHLVMPGGTAGTRKAMRFLARQVSADTYVNLMAQYRPCGEAADYPPLDRGLTDREFLEAQDIAQEEGIHRLDRRRGRRILRFL